MFESIERLSVGYLSINDHTPARASSATSTNTSTPKGVRGDSGLQRARHWRYRGADSERCSSSEALRTVYQRIGEAARINGTVFAHMTTIRPRRSTAVHLGARVAEFPVTVEAAEASRELGMAIVVGAPNIVRGGSQSGNLDAREMIQLGLADIICADYHAPSLLPSAFRLLTRGSPICQRRSGTDTQPGSGGRADRSRRHRGRAARGPGARSTRISGVPQVELYRTTADLSSAWQRVPPMTFEA